MLICWSTLSMSKKATKKVFFPPVCFIASYVLLFLFGVLLFCTIPGMFHLHLHGYCVAIGATDQSANKKLFRQFWLAGLGWAI